MFFGCGSAHNGRTMPILRKTQLDHDINLPPKFYQDQIKTHGAMLGTDTDRQTQTDRQTHNNNEYSGHLFFFVKIFFREPIIFFVKIFFREPI